MKILTLNTHSLQEKNYDLKLEWFIAGILRETPDIIAMQEVNQTADGPLIDSAMLEGQVPVPGARPVRGDNHAANVAFRLRQAGLDCSWVWLPIKLGYGKYDEGVAILSIGRKIQSIDAFPITKNNDYNDWRTRAVLGVQVEGMSDWFYTLHTGWWDESKNGFLEQWNILSACLVAKRLCGQVWLMGDFNAPDMIRNQSYDFIRAQNWQDTYHLAYQHDSGITVPGIIDGWREKLAGQKIDGMRLDYIWSSRWPDVLTSRVVFNGVCEPVVSDHFGILIETKE